MPSIDLPSGTPIDGAVALVTGGNRGFGRAVVDELLERGAAKVYATSRSSQPARDRRIVPLILDVADDASVAGTAKAAPDISILVNNAGVSLATPVLTAPLSDIRDELETNLFGIIRVARAFAPVLAEHPQSSMVNVLSVLSWLSFGRGYEISKAAAWSATNSLRLALREQGTVVTALHVAFMDTDMTAGLDAPKADPRDIARRTADAIIAGDFEVLADDTTRAVKSQLSQGVTALYTQLTRRMTQSGELAHEQRQELPAAKSSALSLPPATSDVTSFRVQVPERAVRDLHSRIRNARWPEKELAPDWSQGVPLSDARDFVEYWASCYDWRRLEAEINSFGNYRTRLDGVGIHFIHAESPHANALPLILTHGWPGSIVEFLDCIGPLVDPVRYGGSAKDAFHVIIPSLPGFGFSDRPGERGWNYTRIARAWVELMNRLGYEERWVAQGGDWGSAVVHVLALLKPAGLRAVHTNWPQVVPMRKPDQMTPEEQKAWAQVDEFQTINNGYWREQATRPQTLGYALTDSPIGLATWILEKFQAWTDNSGEPQDALSNDRMLDNISLYWFTETITSSMRLYMECAPAGPGPFNAGRIDFPIAASIFPREIFKAPRSWADRLWPNIVYWNEVDHGGHFAAMEQPDIFVNEVRNAFRTHQGR